jgi:hypothetical protein
LVSPSDQGGTEGIKVPGGPVPLIHGPPPPSLRWPLSPSFFSFSATPAPQPFNLPLFRILSRSYFHFVTRLDMEVSQRALGGPTREEPPPHLPKLPLPQSCRAHSCANPAVGGMQMAVIVCPRMGLAHLCSFSSLRRWLESSFT